MITTWETRAVEWVGCRSITNPLTSRLDGEEGSGGCRAGSYLDAEEGSGVIGLS